MNDWFVKRAYLEAIEPNAAPKLLHHWQNNTTMAEIGMPLETNMTANKSVNKNSSVQPAESDYPTQDCRSSCMAFETIPVVSPVGSEANCHPNGNPYGCQRPAAGQLARKIV